MRCDPCRTPCQPGSRWHKYALTSWDSGKRMTVQANTGSDHLAFSLLVEGEVQRSCPARALSSCSACALSPCPAHTLSTCSQVRTELDHDPTASFTPSTHGTVYTICSWLEVERVGAEISVVSPGDPAPPLHLPVGSEISLASLRDPNVLSKPLPLTRSLTTLLYNSSNQMRQPLNRLLALLLSM